MIIYTVSKHDLYDSFILSLIRNVRLVHVHLATIYLITKQIQFLSGVAVVMS